MPNAATVLDGIRQRGARGLPLERRYRHLCNPQFYLMAYGRLSSTQGAMPPGGTGETVDGMSLEKISVSLNARRRERYRGSPAKRVHIPKQSGKRRPLGRPTWSAQRVAEVVRLLLEAYYDVQCSEHAHGFRPGRGCHTALDEVVRVWKGTPWCIEGDIADCFGRLDHEVRRSILAEKSPDGRFLRLLSPRRKAGYLEDWRWNATLSGAPQGGVARPILRTIYLERLGQFVEQPLRPESNHGRRRRRNPAYQTAEDGIQRAKRHGDRAAVRGRRRQRRTLPSQDPNDPHYRRLRDVRDADDWLLGFAGPKHEAQESTSRIRTFLRDALTRGLSASKTLLTHATSPAARFLGSAVRAPHADDKRDRRGQRAVNAAIGLFVPTPVIGQRRARYISDGKPAQRGALRHDDDGTIAAKDQAEYRGLVQSSLLAQDVFRLGTLHGVMATSRLKTLARKHRATVMQMARTYKATIETPEGRSPSSAMGVGSRWSPASAGARSTGSARPSSPTSRRSWPAPGATSGSTGSSPSAARAVTPRGILRCTMSASSPTSTSQAAVRDLHGCISWPSGGARPSWSAVAAMRTSALDESPCPSGSDHWRAGCREPGKPCSGRGRRSRTPTGTSPAAYFTLRGGDGGNAVSLLDYDWRDHKVQDIRAGVFHPTRFASPQLTLLPLTPQDSIVVSRARPSKRRAVRSSPRPQLLLFEVVPAG